MAWQEKLETQASYQSPTGKIFIFQYENLSKAVTKKTTVFDFLDADGSYVQDLGSTGRRYPLEIIFWGSDCDDVADSFEDALLERGIGVLNHPMYGTKNVVAIETISRRDNVKSQANQVTITVTFFETVEILYPTSQIDAGSEIENTIVEANSAIANKYKDNLDITTPGAKANIGTNVNNFVKITDSNLRNIANKTRSVQQKFDNIKRSIDSNITTLVSDPIALAQQINQLTQTPARSTASITARLEAYENLAKSTISQSSSDNKFYTDDLFATGYLIGTVISAINAQFITQRDAIDSAETILDLSNEIEQWRENNGSQIDTGEAYQQIQKIVSLTAGYLIELSFSLKFERQKTLDRDRTVIDLVAELFGNIDENLDFFITSNNLSGSEILLLRRGKQIVYYI